MAPDNCSVYKSASRSFWLRADQTAKSGPRPASNETDQEPPQYLSSAPRRWLSCSGSNSNDQIAGTAVSPHSGPLCKDNFLEALDRTSAPPESKVVKSNRSLFGFLSLGKQGSSPCGKVFSVRIPTLWRRSGTTPLSCSKDSKSWKHDWI